MVRFIVAILVVLNASQLWAEASRNSVIAERMKQRELTQSIEGALIYLADTQIKPHAGWHSPLYDSCEGNGCLSTMPINIGILRRLPGAPALPPFPKVQNREGEWANSIHLFPATLGNRNGETFVSILDSNMFVTANLLYPLFLFRDESSEGFIGEMRAKAMSSILTYQRGEGFNFWPSQASQTGSHLAVKPYNLPMLKQHVKIEGFFARFLKPGDPRAEWSRFFKNPAINPWGAESLVNIPNDADDTALALASIHLYQTLAGPRFSLDEIQQKSDDFEHIAAGFSAFRDEGERREDGRDSWKGSGSGAFLTWLKPDSWGAEAFAHPGLGVMPLGVNNVDCVVNANVLFALGMRGDTHAAGFDETVGLVAKAINDKAWPRCGLYYPQDKIFPYAASRAFREGNISDSRLEDAMARLAQDLIADQASVRLKVPGQAGAFSGGVDKSYHLATALAVSSLLNIGVEIAEKHGFLAGYNRAIQDGVTYLLRERVAHKVLFSETLANPAECSASSAPRYGYRWTSGLFFSASEWDLAQWRSEAYTVAMVMEALTKYMLAYELSQQPLMSDLKVTIKQQPYNVEDGHRSWQFIVE